MAMLKTGGVVSPFSSLLKVAYAGAVKQSLKWSSKWKVLDPEKIMLCFYMLV